MLLAELFYRSYPTVYTAYIHLNLALDITDNLAAQPLLCKVLVYIEWPWFH